MYFRTETTFLARFLLTGFLIFGGLDALSASENEVLEVSEIIVHQTEVDRVLSIPVFDNVSILDQDDFFVLDSKAVVGTKTHRTDSIRKKVLSFELRDFVITFHDPHSNFNFQNSNLNPGAFLSSLVVSQDFPSRIQKSILIKTNPVSSPENFEVLKVKNDSIVSRSLTSDRISLLVLSLSFLFGSDSYLLSVFFDNHFQQMEWVVNLKERIEPIPISRFSQNWKESHPYSIPNSVRRSELRSALTKNLEKGIIAGVVGTGKNKGKEILPGLRVSGVNLLNPGKTTNGILFWLRSKLGSKSTSLKTIEIVEMVGIQKLPFLFNMNSIIRGESLGESGLGKAGPRFLL